MQIARLSAEDWIRRDEVIRVHGKGDKTRYVPAPTEVAEASEVRLDGRGAGPLLPRMHHGGHLGFERGRFSGDEGRRSGQHAPAAPHLRYPPCHRRRAGHGDTGPDNGSVDRWWGVIGLEPCTAEVRIGSDDVVKAKRLLRGALRAQGRRVQRRVRRVDRKTGEVRCRAAVRHYQLRSLRDGAGSGCSYLTNDGAALAVALARALDDEPSAWPAGQPRPLPSRFYILTPKVTKDTEMNPVPLARKFEDVILFQSE